MENTAKQPAKDTRFKTSDVTNTKGLKFSEFGLSEKLQLGIYEMGFENPSPIQEESIPKAILGTNIIARAKNGTGKTGAYSIPLLNRIDPECKDLQALVLVPTRELAMQTSYVITNLGKHLDIKCMVSTGGTSIKEDFYRLQNNPHVMVGTPGRILDLAEKKAAKLDNCKILVLDECDKLLSNDFQDIVVQIIRKMSREEKQLMLFSATFPQEIKAFQQAFVPSPHFINLMDELTLKGVTQYYAYLDESEKLHCLNTLF
jgi:ATP-dependent RNA helicase DDX6/DHH1